MPFLLGLLGGLVRSALFSFFAQGLGYLRDKLLPPAPDTNPVGTPYAPPFTGGQCNKQYAVSISTKQGGVYQPPFTAYLQGAIGAPTNTGGNSWEIPYNGGVFAVTSQAEPIVSVTPSSGADDCGNLPNPNPPPSIAEDGLAEGAAPNLLGGASPIVLGSPLAPNGGGALASGANSDFNEAAGLAPAALAGAIGKIAEGLSKLAQLLSLLNEILELLRKLFDKGNKSSYRYDFGLIQKDGFINMQPSSPLDEIEWSYIDIQVVAIKIGIGKVFGNKSPNYYLYEPIGRISFVSPTFGVLSTHPIQFVRTSIPVPPLAIGFFYHLGLEGTNKANVSGFYLKQEE